ncbi:MAG: efflux RND transporter permease subunit, partial [Planctomycetia bacterium]|nr:efflux RND transporter permease subunit [Planctomycetia bacterium]
LVDQVRRVELWGLPEERIEIDISRAKMTELNVHPLSVVLALQSQNITGDSGEMTIGDEKIRVAPNGSFQSIEEIENLILPDGTAAQLAEIARRAASGTPVAGLLAKLSQSKGEGSRLLRLRDIARVSRVAKEEPSKIMRSNGKRAVAIALSPVPNGNVIRMGHLVQERLNQIKAQWPLGVDYEIISYQPQNVEVSIHAFTKNLREAIIIVTLVVMIAMGWRSGLLITSSLLIVILGTLCVLKPIGMDLHRSSLGALIIALGILVDDAVVVGDLILVRMQRGMDREKACIEGAHRAANQLLGATIVGALAFWPIYLSPGKTGQYAGALFVVLAISLMISWFVAMLQTPVVYYMFVHPPKADDRKDPHGGPVYRIYRRMLETVLHHKTLALLLLVGMLYLSAQGFKLVPKIFFPRAQRTQFMVDYWLPEGSSINAVSEDAAKIEEYLKGLEGVKNIGSFLGSGPPRFYLPYEPEFPNSSYGQLVVNVNSLKDIDRLIPQVDKWIKDHFPQAQTRVQRFALGPTTKTEVEVRVSGPEIETLRQIAGKVRDVLDAEPTATFVRDNWREMIPTWSPEYSQSKGTRALVSRGEMIFSLRWATKGLPIASYADGETLLPIVVRSAAADR